MRTVLGPIGLLWTLLLLIREFHDRAIGGVVRAGLKNLKLCMRLAIMLYFEVIKYLVLGGGRAVGPRGSKKIWTLFERSP